MATGYVLYNNLAGTEADHKNVEALKAMLGLPLNFIDITKVTSYCVFFRGMEPEDVVVVSGGDGTLNRFVNDIQGIEIPCDIQYFPNGTGNRFAGAMGWEKGCQPVSLKQVLPQLPTVTVDGKEYRFLHTVDLRSHHGPVHATVTVDGERRSFRKVWLTAAMWEKQLSVMLYHNAGRLRAWLMLPRLLRERKQPSGSTGTVLHGRQITVEWDAPCALMVDGEAFPNVSVYTVKAGGTVC